MLEGKTYKRLHELKTLYDCLNPSTQKRIKESFDSAFHPTLYEKIQRDKGQPVDPNGVGIETILERLNLGFEKWRYAFEDDDDEISYGDQELCGAVYLAILEIKPEWEAILESLHTHTTSPTH